MLEHLKMMARYNKWANERISDAICAIDEADYMKPRDAFFGSIHGTVNHLLLADRIWLGRMMGKPYHVSGLDQIVCSDRDTFIRERDAENGTIIAYLDSHDAGSIEDEFTYANFSGAGFTDTRRFVFAHMLNHATHHRAQVHALLTQVPADPPSLDMIQYLRQR